MRPLPRNIKAHAKPPIFPQITEFVELLKQHAAGSGIAFLWEQQLLNTPAPSAAAR